MLGLLDGKPLNPSTTAAKSGLENRLMTGKAPARGTRVVTSGTTLTILGNVLGACLMFIYFAVIESSLTFPWAERDLGADLKVFFLGTGLVVLMISVIAHLVLRPLRKALIPLLSGL
jgi:hypothetical protein